LDAQEERIIAEKIDGEDDKNKKGAKKRAVIKEASS
jgi:hypothetical protein